MTLPSWIGDIADNASDAIVEAWLGREELLYEEQFGGPTLTPATDFLVKGPLQYGDSGNITAPLVIVPAAGATPQPAGGLRLEIDGAGGPDPASVSLTVSPFPTHLQALRLVARFRTVPSIPPATGPWAASVFVRQGAAQDDAKGEERIGVTMRVLNGTAGLNAPGNTISPRPPFTNRFTEIFPTTATAVDFSLQLFLDLAGRNYYATLTTPSASDTIPLARSALPWLWPKTAVGLGLARAATSGHAAIDVQSFSVYGILGPGWFGARFSDLIRFGRRALLPRFVPPSPHR